MKTLANTVNEVKRKEEEITRMFYVVRSVEDCPPTIISADRRVLFEADIFDATRDYPRLALHPVAIAGTGIMVTPSMSTVQMVKPTNSNNEPSPIRLFIMSDLLLMAKPNHRPKKLMGGESVAATAASATGDEKLQFFRMAWLKDVEIMPVKEKDDVHCDAKQRFRAASRIGRRIITGSSDKKYLVKIVIHNSEAGTAVGRRRLYRDLARANTIDAAERRALSAKEPVISLDTMSTSTLATVAKLPSGEKGGSSQWKPQPLLEATDLTTAPPPPTPLVAIPPESSYSGATTLDELPPTPPSSAPGSPRFSSSTTTVSRASTSRIKPRMIVTTNLPISTDPNDISPLDTSTAIAVALTRGCQSAGGAFHTQPLNVEACSEDGASQCDSPQSDTLPVMADIDDTVPFPEFKRRSRSIVPRTTSLRPKQVPNIASLLEKMIVGGQDEALGMVTLTPQATRSPTQSSSPNSLAFDFSGTTKCGTSAGGGSSAGDEDTSIGFGRWRTRSDIKQERRMTMANNADSNSVLDDEPNITETFILEFRDPQRRREL